MTGIDTSLLGDVRQLVLEILDDHRQAGLPTGFDAELWQALASSELLQLGEVEELGVRATMTVVGELAAAGALLPVAEHDLLAGWLCGLAGIERPSGIATVGFLDADERAHAVPWAVAAERVLLVDPAGRIAVTGPEQFTLTPGQNLAGEGRDELRLTQPVDWVDVGAPVRNGLLARGALVRAVQMVATGARAVELTIDHAREREQFGRPIARFQAVQQLIADAAAEAELARTATDWALGRLADGAVGDDLDHAVAVARSCAGQAASVIARNAHQVHGAIGTTAEHRLHRSTVPLLAWRSEFGTQTYWEQRLLELLRPAVTREDRLLPQVDAQS